MPSAVKQAHILLWSLTGVTVVLVLLVLLVYKVLHHPPSHCPDDVAKVVYRDVTSWNNSYDPPVVSQRAHIPTVVVCRNGQVIGR